MNDLRVAVLGAGGMAGGELLRLLAGHPNVSGLHAYSHSHEGKPVHAVHRGLRHLLALDFEAFSPSKVLEDADVLFSALPHGKSMSFLADLTDSELPCIVDLAADFRLHDREAFERSFMPHTCFDLVSRYRYGLPEAFRNDLKGHSRIANPGCFATAVQLALLPLAKESILPVNPAVYAVTGSSGSGIHPKPGTHHPHRHGNFWAYKLLAHQHEPEIVQTIETVTGQKPSIRLLPHSGPFVRGIHTTTYLEHEIYSDLDAETLFRDYYSDHPFVTVTEAPPQVAEVAGTNHVHVHVTQSQRELVITLALDNLVKGAAGQAIQNMNLSLGLEETAGLQIAGGFPC